MPLTLLKLQASLRDLVANPPSTIDVAAEKWAEAYVNYASDATAAGSFPLMITTQLKPPPVFQELCKPLMTLFSGSMVKQTFLTDLPVNLGLFWVTPAPISFVGPNNGPATKASGDVALGTAIAAMATANGKSNAGTGSLDNLATAIDLWTKTMIIALVTPAGVPIPTPLL